MSSSRESTRSLGTVVKAFLLAAGRGDRLRPLTDARPKCLLPVNGHPMLEYWLRNIHASEISETIVNVSWLAPQVESFLERRTVETTTRVYSEERLLGSAGTIAANGAWALEAETIVVVYADVYTDVPLQAVIDFHRSHSKPITLVVFETDQPERCGIASVDAAGIVTRFREKPKAPDGRLAAAGIYVFSRDAIQRLIASPRGDARAYDLGADVLPGFAGEMMAFRAPGVVWDVGTPELYAAAHDIARHHPAPGFAGR